MSYTIGTDIGGTCTDSVIMTGEGDTYIGKALSTSPDLSEGIFDSVANAAERMDESTGEVFARTDLFLHSTSVGENAIFEREGATTGLLTTNGFEDTLHATRGGYGRWSGKPFEEVKDAVNTDKAPPLIPADRIEGLTERSYRERTLEPVDEEEVLAAVEAIDPDTVDALACCLLWSVASPENEERVKEIVESEYPDLYVSVSNDLTPKIGEYERTSTTVLNAYLGPAVERYMGRLRDGLYEHGFDGRLLMMFSHGGLVTQPDAVKQPVGLIESGPVGGLLGSRYVGRYADADDIISIDMGGTTFKTGVINDGTIEEADEPMVGRHHYLFPKRDVHSIPVAGGSIVSLDEEGIPEIGPESAGSDPGPVCYDRGGDRPTITDVDLVQGYFSPEFFLGGRTEMDPEAARDVFAAEIAEPLGKTPERAASDIYNLANTKIADLIREVTIEKGIDPRSFTMCSIGGAAGMHAAACASKLDIPEVLVPATASVHSALGLLSTDLVHETATVREFTYPFDAASLSAELEELTAEAREKLDRDGIPDSRAHLKQFVSMRYQQQVHELQTPVAAALPLDESNMDAIVDRFRSLFERRYGEGADAAHENVEITECRVRGVGEITTPDLSTHDFDAGEADPVTDTKEIYFENGGFTETPVYSYESMGPGYTFDGPGVVVTPVTTIVARPPDTAWMDEYGNVRISVGDDR